MSDRFFYPLAILFIAGLIALALYGAPLLGGGLDGGQLSNG